MSDAIPLNEKYEMTQCVYVSPEGKKLNYCRRQFGNAGKESAVVLFLHGAGERGDNNYSQLVHGAKEMCAFCTKNNLNVLALFPQCPANHQWVNTPWGDPAHTMPEESEDMRLAMAMLDQELKETGSDLNKVYVMGISMGGYGTWDAVSRFPELFAAAFPVCGGADTAQASKLTQLPILTFHGDSDTVVPTSRTRDMVQALKAAGSVNVTYCEVPDCGHDSWFTAFRSDASWEWLFKQSRSL
jgi:predicted peptidase